MSTFIARTHLDGAVEIPIVEEFEYMGYTWVVHNSIKIHTDKFRVSHKETGWAPTDYRNGQPSRFSTPQEAISAFKSLLGHVGDVAITQWLTRVRSGKF